MAEGKIRGDVDQAEDGLFQPKYDDEDVVTALVDAHPEPLKVGEVAERVGCSETTAHNRLHGLFDDAYPGLETKKVGANARVWWVNLDQLEQHTTA